MSGQKLLTGFRLLGGEKKLVPAFQPQNNADQAMTQSALAVIEQHRFRLFSHDAIYGGRGG